MSTKSVDVPILMPPVSSDAAECDICDDQQSYKRQDTFGASGMPITVQVNMKPMMLTKCCFVVCHIVCVMDKLQYFETYD